MSTEELRRRVHAATDTIDVPAPNTGALLARARRSHRTTLRNRLVLAVVAVLVIGVAVTFAVRSADEPPVVEDPDLVDGSAQALAALAIQELGLDPGARAVGLADGDDYMSTSIVTTPDGGRNDVTWLSASVVRIPDGADISTESCADGDLECVAVPVDGGEVELRWAPAVDGSGPPPVGGWLRMHYVDATHRVGANLEFHSDQIDGDPRTLDLQFSVPQLADLVADHRFGFGTTAELAGAELPGWEVSTNGTFSPTARDLAMRGDVEAIVSRHLGPARVEESSDGHGIDLDLTVDGLPQIDGIHLAPGGVGASCEPDETRARCDSWHVPSGEVTLLWDFAGEPDEVAFAVWLQGEDFREVSWVDPSYPGGDPRKVDLPVTVDELVALLGDLEIE